MARSSAASASFEEIAALEAGEIARFREGQRRAFYHPARSTNMRYDGRDFVVIGLPHGYEWDLDSWAANGCDGAAPTRKIVVKSAPAPAQPAEDVSYDADPPTVTDAG